MRTLSLAHLTVLDADPLTLIEAAAAGGFDAVGLRIVPPAASDRIVPVVGDIVLQRAIKERLKATGLAIMDVEAIWLAADTSVDALLPALDVGADLGARYVLVCGNDADRSRLIDNFAGLSAAANARGLRTMLEFIPYTEIRNLRSAFDVLRRAAPRDAGLLVDALHLSRSGGSPGDLAGYDPGLFSYIHLCHAPPALPLGDAVRAEAREGRLYPGEGSLWLAAFLDAFPPATPVGVEAPNAKLAGLSAVARGRRAGEASRRLLRQHDGQEFG